MTELSDLKLSSKLLIQGREVHSAQDLANCVIEESNDHVQRTRLADQDQLDDFRMSCDALNYWRICMRLHEEQISSDIDGIKEVLRELICNEREYDPDEFDFALDATKDRPRSAFGLGPLEQAHLRSKSNSFHLLVSDLKDSKVANDIASIAYELQKEIGESNIYLPIEQLRILLGRRKIVVSGVVRRLVQSGVINMVNEKYHTRRAREYQFSGEQGVHFKIGQKDDDKN